MVNIRGRNIYQGEPVRFPDIKPSKTTKEGYGVSFKSELIDKQEKEPMKNLQTKFENLKMK